jgi:hypothetical protein
MTKYYVFEYINSTSPRVVVKCDNQFLYAVRDLLGKEIVHLVDEYPWYYEEENFRKEGYDIYHLHLKFSLKKT